MCDPNRGYSDHEAIAAILILSLIFYYWHNVLEAVVSDSLTFLVSASAEGCFSALTVLFHNLCPIAIVTSAILTKIALCHYSNAFKTIKKYLKYF